MPRAAEEASLRLATYCAAMALSGRLVAACRSSEASVHSWKRGIWMAADLVRVRVRARRHLDGGRPGEGEGEGEGSGEGEG